MSVFKITLQGDRKKLISINIKRIETFVKVLCQAFIFDETTTELLQLSTDDRDIYYYTKLAILY